MKYLKHVMLTTLCALFFVSLSITVSASSSSAIAKKQYNSFIKKNDIGGYKIVDIDKNGIPELCYFNRKTWKNCVMTYVKSTGRMKVLCAYNSGKGYGAYYSVSKHMVALPWDVSSGITWKIYKISGTKATLVVTYSHYRNQPYKKNGKTTSQSTFSKAVQMYQKWNYVTGTYTY